MPQNSKVVRESNNQEYNVRNFSILVKLAQQLISCHSLSEVINETLSCAMAVIDVSDKALFFLYDEAQGLLQVQGAVGFEDFIYDLKVKPGEIMSGRAFASGQPAMYNTQEEVAAAGSSKYYDAFSIAARTQKPKSAILVPLKLQETPIGVILLENFLEEYSFNSTDLNILQLLANQSAIAIEKVRFYEFQKTLAQNLENATQVHNSLNNIILQNKSVSAILELLGNTFKNPIVFFPKDDQLPYISNPLLPDNLLTYMRNFLAQNYPTPVSNLPDNFFRIPLVELDRELEPDKVDLPESIDLVSTLYVSTVYTGSEFLGWLTSISNQTDLDKVLQYALEYSATVIGFIFLRDKVTFTENLLSQTEFINNFLTGNLTPTMENWARRLGISTEGNTVCIYFEIDNFSHYIELNHLTESEIRNIKSQINKKLLHLIQKNTPDPFFNCQGDSYIGFLSLGNLPRENWTITFKQIGQTLQNWLKGNFPDISISMATSNFCRSIFDIQSEIREIRRILKLFQRIGRTSNFISMADIGADQILLGIPDQERATGFASRILGPIIEYDRLNHTDLLVTLLNYSNNNRNINETASKLNTHPNTVRYRIERIIDLLGISSKDSEGWFNIDLALRISRLSFGEITPTKLEEFL